MWHQLRQRGARRVPVESSMVLTRTARPSRPLRVARESLVVAAAAVLLAAVVLSLWRARWGEPFNYDGDALYYPMLVRSIGRSGTYLTNPHLGWPFGLNLSDYPEGGDNLHWSILAALQQTTGSATTAINIFYVASFGTVAAAAHASFRYMGARRVTAAAMALLFAFAPYHFARNESHLMLSSYAMVPLGVLLAVAVLSGDRLLLRTDSLRIDWRAGRTWVVLLVTAMLASTGSYYFTFSMLLVGVAAVAAAAVARSWRPVVTGVVLTAVGTTTFALNILPSIVGRIQDGSNAAVANRSATDTEQYGLRIAQLFLPRDNHRVPVLAAIAARSQTHTILHSEAGQQLGIVGACGLVVLLVWVVMRLAGDGQARHDPSRRLLGWLGLLAGTCLLLGAVGSLSYVAAAVGLRPIRAWNRISIVIEFCSLAAVAVVVDRLARSVDRRPRLLRLTVGLGLPLAVLGVGLADQTTPSDRPHYAAIHQQYTSDRDFFRAVADRLPPGTPVFQLPYVPFPEGSGPGIGAYDQGRGFVFQPQLAWSFGFMRGRHADYPFALERQPTDQWLTEVVAIGFRSVVVDNNGYAGGGTSPDADLIRLTHSPGLTSRDGRYTFVDLRGFAEEVQQRMSPPALAALAQRTLGS